jgi:transposase
MLWRVFVLSIRKTKTASGAKAVQIVYYKNRKVVIEKHIGSGKTEQEIELLVKRGKDWIAQNSLQGELFPANTTNTVSLTDLKFLGITHRFAYQLLERVAAQCGLAIEEDRFLFDFSIIRLIEPTSKLRTIKLLERYFEIIYSERTVYRRLLDLSSRKQTIEAIALKCAQAMLQEDLSLVLYDVTTLYFETFKGDELRIEGFSKDNKPQQPQIVIGLIVTRQGFPLSYEVFPGNTFEGKTMLSLLDNFTKKNGVNRPIIVADSAMLSQKNIEELKKRKLSYIVGARLGNTPLKIIKDAHNKLQNKNGKSIRINTDNGDLIVEFSIKRYRKDKNEMDKQLLKAKQLVEGKALNKRIKFVKHKNKDNQYILNEPLVEKTKLLLGRKGYYTNIAEEILSNQDIIKRYHDLWNVEQAFRMAKSDLASRPVFHHKNESIRSHILICFTALIMEKYLEINTKLSLKQVIDAIWVITDAKLYNRTTKTAITIRSEINQNSKVVLNKLNPFLSY